MHSAETSYLVDLEGIEIVTEAKPELGLQTKTWVINAKLEEVSLFVSEAETKEGFAPGFSAGKFLCHLKDDSTSEQGFMRIYCQIPCPGTEWKASKVRATQVVPSIELVELLAFKSFAKQSCPAVPRLLGYQEGKQADDGKVPGGFTATIVWEKVPGFPLSRTFFWDLDEKQRESIRQEFQRAYEQLVQCGYEPFPPTFSKLIYDDSTGKMYFKSLNRDRRIRPLTFLITDTSQVFEWLSPPVVPNGKTRILLCTGWQSSLLGRIDYMSRRIDHWVEDFREILERDQNGSDWNSQRWLGQEEAAVKAWTTMTDLTIKFDTAKQDVKSRFLVVQQAYTCLSLTQVPQLLSTTFGDQRALRLWNKLRFIARPLVDCRLLRSIAAREQQLRSCRILLVTPKSKTTLEAKYRIGIFEAWERLGLGSVPERVVRKLDPFNEDFEEACASTFSLHAEMQLVVHYEERCALRPTLDYFGCSKQTCLLCETFLHALPSSIATRGRHGICYPAWGVPGSNSGDIEVAVQQLEKSFVAHIRGFLGELTNPKQKAVAENIVQSDMVSDFSRFTLEDWQRKDQHVLLFESNETMKQNVSGLSARQDRITQLATTLPTIYIEPRQVEI